MPSLPAIPTLTPYRMDVQQGNVVTQDMVEKLKPGMTPSQVRFILGTPLVVDAFHKDRWDYVYRFSKAGTLQESRRIVIVFEDDKLARIEGDVVPAKAGSSEGGVTIAPTPGKPTDAKPAAQKPAAQNPGAQQNTGAAEKPAAQNPAAEQKPAAQNSAAEQKPAEPAVQNPGAENPAADKPASDVTFPKPEPAPSGASSADAPALSVRAVSGETAIVTADKPEPEAGTTAPSAVVTAPSAVVTAPSADITAPSAVVAAPSAVVAAPGSDAVAPKAGPSQTEQPKEEKPTEEKGFFGRWMDKLGF